MQKEVAEQKEGTTVHVKARDGGSHHLKYQQQVSLTLKGRNCFIRVEWYIKYSRLPSPSITIFCLKCLCQTLSEMLFPR
jgi:hypothetical protein